VAIAVRWLLDQGPLIALWGARRPEQLAPVRDAIGWSLDTAALLEIDRIIAEHIVDPVGPEFMAPPLQVPVPGEVTAVMKAAAWELSRRKLDAPGYPWGPLSGASRQG
jgi:hypothetical protein